MRPFGIRLGMFWALFVASVLMFVRNRAAVFFSLFLPLIIMLIFGVLNFEGATTIQLGIVDEARNAASADLIDGLAAFDYIEPTSGSRDAELADLEDGDLDFVLVIPDGFNRQPGVESKLVAYASTADPAQAQVGQGLLQQAVGTALFATAGGGNPPGGAFAPPVTFELVKSRDLGYIDFLVPGIVGMTVMQLGLFGVAFGFVHLKRTGALRRLFATPTSPAYFLGAQVASRLIICAVQVAILLGIGIWFGLQMFGDYASLAVIVLLAAIIFLAVGFSIAGWAKNEDQAAPVANLISLPMMFLSGVFFPRDAMPDFLASITQFMPLTYVNEALRAVVNDGAGLASLGPELLGMGVWAIITFVLAVRLFKWE
ncbi:MAG TPA: ABC transporter permease [Candidatus Limnocylindria bacterium]|jgi:ABC-2 type transport system permease protein|nr:ABC transporter permease [Candidatus Limnocylindria bacterium]